jgi:hypothetical protein
VVNQAPSPKHSADALHEMKDRRERMRHHDAERLKAKAESGQLEGEQVHQLVKKLEVHIKDHPASIRFLAEERKARVVVEVENQLRLKAARVAKEKEWELEYERSIVNRLLQDQARDDERARQKAEEKRRVQSDIREQLASNAYRRIMDSESRDLEGAILRDMARRAAEVEEAAAAARAEAGRQLARETMDANRRFAARDERRRAKEADEERAILEYQLQKAAMQAEADRVKAADKAAAEKRTAELRAKQKKALDGRAADDEARARRHEEAKILAERAKAKVEAEAREKARQEVIVAVEKQLVSKARHAEEEKQKDVQLMERFRDDMAEAVRRESERRDKVVKQNLEAVRALREQKQEAEAKRADEAQRPYFERQQTQMAAAAERIAVESFRAGVLDRMGRDKLALDSTFAKNITKIKSGR